MDNKQTDTPSAEVELEAETEQAATAEQAVAVEEEMEERVDAEHEIADPDVEPGETPVAENTSEAHEEISELESDSVGEGSVSEAVADELEASEPAEPTAEAEDQDGLDLAAVFEEQPLERILEAMIGSSRVSLSIDRMIKALGEHAPEKAEVREALGRLAEDCASRSVDLKETASGFRFQVRQDFAPWVARLSEEKPQRYSRAALETLALIAYRQPITRGEIEEVRGVAVSTNIIRTLEERNWVRVVGHKDVPGRPALFATTREFLDYFGMKALTELPTLEAVKDLDAMGEKLAGLDQGGKETSGAPAVAEDGTDSAESPEIVSDAEDGDVDPEFDMAAMFASPEADREPQEISVSSAVEAAMAMDIGMTLEAEPDEAAEDESETEAAFLIGEVFSPVGSDDEESPAEIVAEPQSEPVPG